ncbi:MAG: pyridoxamine 5'-phosphate oxidase family protein [Candidatus Omnitrophota bacterium]|jgi:uncharacterized pyridoxamine 5'-phosphate oxidase family protein
MTKEEIFDLIKDAGYCILATIEQNKPKARPMMPCLTEDGELLLACLAHCRTINQIKNNPNVELCYLDRMMRFARVSGKAALSENKERKEYVWNNIPMLRQYFIGPDDTNFILVVIKIENIEVMTPQQRDPQSITL